MLRIGYSLLEKAGLQHTHRKRFSPRSAQAGFSLIELMVVLAVLAVTLLLAAPAFTDLIRDNRMISSVYSLRATLNLARSEALARRTPVVVCGTEIGDGEDCSKDTDWSSGYMAFIGNNEDDSVDTTNPGLSRLHWEERPGSAVSIVYSRNFLRFDSMGAALGSAGTIVFCDERGASSARGLIVSNVGSVRAATDDDDSGVVNDGTGADVQC